MPSQSRAGRPSPCICLQSRGLSEHQSFFGSWLYIYNTDLIYRTKLEPLILLTRCGNLRVGAVDRPTPRSARKGTLGEVMRAKARASAASGVIRAQSPPARGSAGPATSRPRRPNWEGLKIRTHFQRHAAGWAKLDVKKRVAPGLGHGRKELDLGEVIFLRLHDLATGATPGSSARPAPRAPPRSAQLPESPARLASPARRSRPLYSWGYPPVLIKASHRHTALPPRRCAACQQ